MRMGAHVDGKGLGVEWLVEQCNREMIKIEQGTSFDGERRCVIDNSGGHDGVADDGNGGGHSLVGIRSFPASRQPDLS